MAPKEAPKTLSQKIADEAVKAPVAAPQGRDAELEAARENHPNANKVFRDERGNITVHH